MAQEPEEVNPEVLWKYRPWNDHARRMITKSEVYFSKRPELNDPLDCCWIEKNVPRHPAEQMKFAKLFCNKFLGPETNEQRLKNLLIVLRAIKAVASFHGYERRPTLLDFHLGVLCLSEINDNYVMWSHYADQHRGICVGVRTHFHGKILRPCLYRDSPPVIDVWDYVRPLHAALVDALRSKGSEWSYEKEWRTIHHPGPMRLTKFVDSVIIGACADTATRSSVLDAVSEAGYSIKVFQGKFHRSKNEIAMMPVECKANKGASK